MEVLVLLFVFLAMFLFLALQKENRPKVWTYLQPGLWLAFFVTFKGLWVPKWLEPK